MSRAPQGPILWYPAWYDRSGNRVDPAPPYYDAYNRPGGVKDQAEARERAMSVDVQEAEKP